MQTPWKIRTTYHLFIFCWKRKLVTHQYIELILQTWGESEHIPKGKAKKASWRRWPVTKGLEALLTGRNRLGRAWPIEEEPLAKVLGFHWKQVWGTVIPSERAVEIMLNGTSSRNVSLLISGSFIICPFFPSSIYNKITINAYCALIMCSCEKSTFNLHPPT